MRKRLRPKYTDEQLAEIYAVPHGHDLWVDHIMRVDQTVAVGKQFAKAARSIGDLSTGDGAIPFDLATVGPQKTLYLGDFAPSYDFEGPIEKTIHEIPHVDLFILSETLEHLDDPDSVLRDIRGQATSLLLSTPLAEDNDGNPEHYWSWDKDDVREMLVDAGWSPQVYSCIQFEYLNNYGFQIWGCL